MKFKIKENVLTGKYENETIVLEAWGTNAIRVRATQYPRLEADNVALDYVPSKDVDAGINEEGAYIRNGKLKACITNFGHLSFYNGDKLLLKEYYRAFGASTPHSPSMKLMAREFLPIIGGAYKIT